MTNTTKKSFKLVRWITCAGTAMVLLLPGCASAPKPIPAGYLNSERPMAVQITRINEKAQFRDSGQGGLIGAMVGLSRQSSMREKMEGIQASAVKDLLRQELTRNLEEAFYIEEQSDELRIDVNIITWGWFLPTGILGIKSGDYQTEIVADVQVFDLKLPKKQQKIAFTQIRAMDPLGSEPDDAKVQESLLKCADKFGKQVVDFLLQRNPTDMPRTN